MYYSAVLVRFVFLCISSNTSRRDMGHHMADLQARPTRVELPEGGVLINQPYPTGGVVIDLFSVARFSPGKMLCSKCVAFPVFGAISSSFSLVGTIARLLDDGRLLLRNCCRCVHHIECTACD